MEESKSSSIPTRRILLDGLYGIINGILVIPISISFTTIIFRHDYYQFALPTLIKLVIFSSMIHQVSFSALSTLPYSIGQVQDAGLIFLSAMSASIANQLIETPDSIIPTCLFAISIYTAALGIVLIVLGHFRMASIVQYIPMPVIGGYLAFIGFFCAEAAFSIMAGISVGAFGDIPLLFTTSRLIHIVPGVVCGTLLFVLLPILKSPAVLPLFLIAIMALFYLTLSLTNTTLEDAREREWVSAMQPTAPWYDVWKYFVLEKVCWSCIPSQVTRWLTMTVVVGFSSCLDVAAIEMESSLPLDYNKELQVVGWSNVFSGCSGGFTGSYIFTQTIFSFRRGVKTRVCGLVTAFCELAVVLLPTPITCYVPKFLFGSLLILIALDLVIHWLVLSRDKMTTPEYLICLSTFLGILNFGVQRGLFGGLVLAVFIFVFKYSSAPTVSISCLQQSKVARSYQDRCFLVGKKGSIIRVQPKGFVFFGTAVSLLDEVKRHILAPDDLVNESNSSTGSTRRPFNRSTYDSPGGSDIESLKQHSEHSPLIGSSEVAAELFTDETVVTKTNRVEFAVFDFSHVLGIDASAAHSCFLLLTKLLKASNIVPVYTQLNTEVEKLLRAQGVIDEDSVYIPNSDDALEWCEDCLLDRLLLKQPKKRGHSFYAGRQRNRLASFEDLNMLNSQYFEPITPIKNVSMGGRDYTRLCMILDDYLEGDKDSSDGYVSPFQSNLHVLEKYFKRHEFNKGQVLFDIGRTSRYLYLIEIGSVEILSSEPVERVQKLSSGAIFGESEFLLKKPYSTRCYTLTPSFIWTVNKKKYQEMQINHPLIFLEFQKILLLSLSVSHISTGFQLHPSTAYHIVFKKQPTVPAQLEMQYPPEIPNVFSPYMFHSP